MHSDPGSDAIGWDQDRELIVGIREGDHLVAECISPERDGSADIVGSEHDRSESQHDPSFRGSVAPSNLFAMVDVRPLAQSEIDSVGAVLGLVRLDQGDGFYLVAWDRDEPLGHLHLALTDPPELQDVSVRVEHRRKGVATALVGRAEDGARARGFDRVTLFVGADNAAAQALYRECGYADSGAPPRRVKGTIQARTGPIEVDDTLLSWEKRLTMSTHTDIVGAQLAEE